MQSRVLATRHPEGPLQQWSARTRSVPTSDCRPAPPPPASLEAGKRQHPLPGRSALRPDSLSGRVLPGLWNYAHHVPVRAFPVTVLEPLTIGSGNIPGFCDTLLFFTPLLSSATA